MRRGRIREPLGLFRGLRNSPCSRKSSTARRRCSTLRGFQMSRFQIWLARAPVREIVHDHPKDGKHHLVGIDRAKLAPRDPFADRLHRALVQRPVIGHDHPAQWPPCEHHLPLDQPRVSGVAHRRSRTSRSPGRAHGRAVPSPAWRWIPSARRFARSSFPAQSGAARPVAKIIVGKRLVDPGEARDFVHARPGQPPLREYLAGRHHNAPHRGKLPPLAQNPLPNRRKLPVPHELGLRLRSSRGVGHGCDRNGLI